jgi:precorrin-2 dehydrogenase / sirohydrochlorin ferrochelatase
MPCLVVGGGNIAYRKVLSLRSFNAKITVLSPKVSRPLSSLARRYRIKIIRRPYSKTALKGCKVVFAATNDSKTHAMIRRDCTSEGILLNVVDDPALCDFIMPANIRRGDLTVSVSSQGKAPFYTAAVRKALEYSIAPWHSKIVRLAADLRKHVLSSANQKSPAKKERIFRKFLEADWEKIFSERGGNEARKHVKRMLRECGIS